MKQVKFIKHLFEAILVYIFYMVLRILPLNLSSKIMKSFCFHIGKYLKVNRIAKKNIAKCFPTISKNKTNEIIRGMWHNLGGIIGEMPHWQNISDQELLNYITLPTQVTDGQTILLSGHLGNWELMTRIIRFYQIKSSFLYRPMNNKMVDFLLKKTRNSLYLNLAPKGQEGLREILSSIEKGENIGMLIDQKYSGVRIKFFDCDTDTTALPAKLALKYRLPIKFFMLRRTDYVKYELIQKNIAIDFNDTEKSIMQKIYCVMENWIKTDPEQWFWLHDRWKER